MNCGTHSDGCWNVPAFDAATFTGRDAMTWTVEPADIFTLAYVRFGKTVIYSFVISGTSVGGTPSYELRIALPTGMTVARNALAPIRISENGVVFTGYANPRLNLPHLYIYKLDASAFSASTNATDVQGQVVFEIL